MTTPHVVKFSGGRSSGMMLLELLRGGQLDHKRGDVVLFNNTSAEHPATYDFTRKMKRLVEQQFNIPFFWIEYQTFEDVSAHGTWVRKPTYRLVNDQPRSEANPMGYCYSGEVFEELLSNSGYVPTMLQRNCTLFMKIFVTNAFLADWLAMKSGIARRGHNGSTTKMTDRSIILDHRRAGGGVPDDILLKKRQFVRGCPHYRPAQPWEDFAQADTGFNNPSLEKYICGGKAELYGQQAVNYVSYLGIRSDEAHRAEKIQARINAARDSNKRSLHEQPPGEILLAPLVDNGVDQTGVLEFWRKQSFDLALPPEGHYSNCLYCPLKGWDRLAGIATEEQRSGQFTPISINWWVAMEEKYSRDLKAEGRKLTNKMVNTVGFFGASSKKVYATLKQETETGVRQTHDAEYLVDENYTVCQCTD